MRNIMFSIFIKNAICAYLCQNNSKFVFDQWQVYTLESK